MKRFASLPWHKEMVRRRQALKRAQTIPEKVTKQALEEMGIVHRVQYLVLWRRFRKAYILDFYLPEYRVCIEIDGASHDTRQAYDQIRTNYLREAGITVIRFQNEEMHNHLIAIHLIDTALKGFSPRPVKKIPHRLAV